MNRHTTVAITAGYAPVPVFTIWMNIALISLAVGALILYVVSANTLAAQNWRMADANDQLAHLQEIRNDLVAQQSAMEDRAVLLTLAADAGFVPADGVIHLVEDGPVAAR